MVGRVGFALSLAYGTLALACGGSKSQQPASPPPPADAGVPFTLLGADPAGLEVLPQAVPILTQAQGGVPYDAGDLTALRVELVDPFTFLASGEAAARLGDSPVTPVPVAPNRASYTVRNVDKDRVTALSPGLVVNVLDASAPGVQGATTSTGVVPIAAVSGATAGAVVKAVVPAFVVPGAFADLLAAQALGPGKTHADLANANAGYVLAFTVDPATGTPVAGATVALSTSTGAPLPSASSYRVTYFSAAGTPGASTDATGIVVVTGPPTGTAPIGIIASAPDLPFCTTAQTTGCLAAAFAGIAPGIAFVAPIQKQ